MGWLWLLRVLRHQVLQVPAVPSPTDPKQERAMQTMLLLDGRVHMVPINL